MEYKESLLNEFTENDKLIRYYPLTFMFFEKIQVQNEGRLMFFSENKTYKSKCYALVDLYKPISSIIYEKD